MADALKELRAAEQDERNLWIEEAEAYVTESQKHYDASFEYQEFLEFKLNLKETLLKDAE